MTFSARPARRSPAPWIAGLLVLVPVTLLTGATPGFAATTAAQRDVVTLHFQTTRPHYGHQDRFSGTAPRWANQVVLQERVGTTWHNVFATKVKKGRYSDSVALVTGLNMLSRVVAPARGHHKAVASKPVRVTASISVLYSNTGVGPATSPAVSVGDFSVLSYAYNCPGEPAGNAFSINVLVGGVSIASTGSGHPQTYQDGGLLETDSRPLTLQLGGADDCSWQVEVDG